MCPPILKCVFVSLKQAPPVLKEVFISFEQGSSLFIQASRKAFFLKQAGACLLTGGRLFDSLKTEPNEISRSKKIKTRHKGWICYK